MEKFSFERHVYKSVDDRSLFTKSRKKSTENRINKVKEYF